MNLYFIIVFSVCDLCKEQILIKVYVRDVFIKLFMFKFKVGIVLSCDVYVFLFCKFVCCK